MAVQGYVHILTHDGEQDAAGEQVCSHKHVVALEYCKCVERSMMPLYVGIRTRLALGAGLGLPVSPHCSHGTWQE